MSPAGISLLMLMAFAGFAALTWRKLRIVRALQAERRWDQPWQRLRSVVLNGLLQRRMVRREWRPGLMHAVIFFGFLTLLLRKLHLIVIGYWAAATFPGAPGGRTRRSRISSNWRCWSRSATASGVASSSPGAARTQSRGRGDPDADRTIMLTDFGFDAFRFAKWADSMCRRSRTNRTGRGGGPLAHALTGLTPAALAGRIPGVLLGADGDGVRLSRDPCRSASTSTSSPRCRPVLRARSPREPGAARRSRQAAGRRRRRSRHAQSARRPHST